MLLSKDWSILRVTMLLYLLVALFPVNIYLANTMLSDRTLDTATIRDLKKISGQLQDLAADAKGTDSKAVLVIDRLLDNIETAYMKNEVNQFDVGLESAQVEFATLKGCWQHYKERFEQPNRDIVEQHAACQKSLMKLIVIVDKMSNIKQERALLWLNIALIATMIVMVATIYLVRVSMKRKLERHTIYDMETRLFNRDYFDAELQKACALAVRKQHPLALIAVAIDNYETTIASLEPKQHGAVMKMFGGLMLSMTRTSDTTCRYDAGEFVVITPETNLKNAEVVGQRIHKRIIEHDFLIQHPMTVTISVALQHGNEEMPNLLKRTFDTLHEAKKKGNTIVTADVKK